MSTFMDAFFTGLLLVLWSVFGCGVFNEPLLETENQSEGSSADEPAPTKESILAFQIF